MARNWDAFFAQAFADFPDTRVIEEAQRALNGMEYEIQYDDTSYSIPRDVHLTIVRRSICQDDRVRSGGFLAFEVAVGPHFTAQGVFSGICEYGILRLEFGLDGAYQDEFLPPSPLLTSSDLMVWEYEPIPTAYAVAGEKLTRYSKSTN